MADVKPIIDVKNLSIDYYTIEGVVHAVREVSFRVYSRESACLVGESGSGKSTVGLTIALALPENARIPKGQVLFEGVDLTRISEEERVKYAGKEVSIIFQDPSATLNPLFTIGEQIQDILRYNLGIHDSSEAMKIAEEMLKKVGLPDAKRVLRSYPHELSGGMAQRVNIAIALSTKPKLLIADEPTTMLDVTLQAQILDLLRKLKEELNLSMIFITHNLGVAAEICDRIIVMYAGVILEEGLTNDVLINPLHPYTKGLLECVPRAHRKVQKLKYIPGTLPDLRFLPKGCVFAERCSDVMDICRRSPPPYVEVTPNHKVACYKYKR